MASPPSVRTIGERPYIWYHARAYRTPDDPLPGDGWAAEPVPGATQFTRDSELMNAETAAWGRAIVALGFETKKIASRQEVRARSSEGGQTPPQPPSESADPPPSPLSSGGGSQFQAPAGKPATKAAKAHIANQMLKSAELAGKSLEAIETAFEAKFGPLTEITAEGAKEAKGWFERAIKNLEKRNQEQKAA